MDDFSKLGQGIGTSLGEIFTAGRGLPSSNKRRMRVNDLFKLAEATGGTAFLPLELREELARNLVPEEMTETTVEAVRKGALLPNIEQYQQLMDDIEKRDIERQSHQYALTNLDFGQQRQVMDILEGRSPVTLANRNAYEKYRKLQQNYERYIPVARLQKQGLHHDLAAQILEGIPEAVDLAGPDGTLNLKDFMRLFPKAFQTENSLKATTAILGAYGIKLPADLQRIARAQIPVDIEMGGYPLTVEPATAANAIAQFSRQALDWQRALMDANQRMLTLQSKVLETQDKAWRDKVATTLNVLRSSQNALNSEISRRKEVARMANSLMTDMTVSPEARREFLVTNRIPFTERTIKPGILSRTRTILQPDLEAYMNGYEGDETGKITGRNEAYASAEAAYQKALSTQQDYESQQTPQAIEQFSTRIGARPPGLTPSEKKRLEEDIAKKAGLD